MKTRTRILSTLLAVLMVLTLCPVVTLSAQESTPVPMATEYWDGTVPGSSAPAPSTSVMDFVLANTEYKATVTDLEGHLEIDETAKEIRILDETGFAIFVILTNNAYTIYEADGETVKYTGTRTGDVFDISRLVGDKVITLEKDLYLNDPAKPVSEWNNLAAMFARAVPTGGSNKTGNVEFDGKGHAIIGWYAKANLTSGTQGIAFGLFGAVRASHYVVIRNVAMLNMEVDAHADATCTYAVTVGGLLGGAHILGTATEGKYPYGSVIVDNVAVDLNVNASSKANAASPQPWIKGDGEWEGYKQIVVGGLVATLNARPLSDQGSNLTGTVSLTNAVVQLNVTVDATHASASAITASACTNAGTTMENLVLLSSFTGLPGNYLKSHATLANFVGTSKTADSIWANGSLHADIASLATHTKTDATLTSLSSYSMRKAQEQGAFSSWNIDGVIAVPANLATQATQIKNAFEDKVFWDGTVPGLIAGDTYATSYAETNNILAEGESVLDFIVANKSYNISKAQFDAHITLGGAANEGRYYGVTINDEIGLAIWAIFTSNDSKIINTDGSVFYSSSVQGTAGYTANGAYKMLTEWDGQFIKLGRNLYLNDPAKPKSEWNEMAPLYLRMPTNPNAVNARTCFDGKNYTVQGWYVNHTLTDKDASTDSFGFFGMAFSNYYALIIRNIAIVDSYMDLTVGASYAFENDGLRVGGLIGRVQAHKDHVSLNISNVAVDTEIHVTVEDTTAYESSQAGLWCGMVQGADKVVSYNKHTKAAVIGGLYGGIAGANVAGKAATFADVQIALKTIVPQGSTAVAMAGVGTNMSFGTLNASNMIVYTDFAEMTGEGFGAPSFNNATPTTYAVTNVLSNGALHWTMTDATCREVGKLDLLSEVFATAKGEGFTNWDTSGQVPVLTSYLASAEFFADTIASPDSDFLKLLGVSVRNTTDPAKQGIRLSTAVNTELATLSTAGLTLRYGSLFIPTVLLNGKMLSTSTADVLNIYQDVTLLADGTVGANSSMWAEYGYGSATEQYNIALVNFPANALQLQFTMRSYISVVDGEGNVLVTLYSNVATDSVVSVAERALAGNTLTQAQKEALETLIAGATA